MQVIFPLSKYVFLTPSTISLAYPNPLQAHEVHPTTQPPPIQPGRNLDTVPDPINNHSGQSQRPSQPKGGTPNPHHPLPNPV